MNDDLIAYSQLLVDWGFSDRAGIRPSATTTNEPAQVASLLHALQAPEALAMLSSYGSGVGLQHGAPDWSASCLPTSSNSTGFRRASTISITRDEVFYVWMDLATGRVGNWGMVVDDSARQSLKKEVEAIGDFEDSQHGLFIAGTGFDSFAELSTFDEVRSSAAQAVEARRAAGSLRQVAWHNPLLASILNLDQEGLNAAGEDAAVKELQSEPWEVKVGYYRYSALARKHQSRARRLLLERTHPRVCAVCGLDAVEVLEAAHLIADSEGGAASSGNLILLCANHHLAMDAGLFSWVDGTAQWKVGTKGF